MSMWSKKADQKKDEGQAKSEVDTLVERLSGIFDEKIKIVGDKVAALTTDWESIKAEASKETPPDPNRKADGTELTEAERLDRDNKANFAFSVMTNARITENDCINSVSGQWPNIANEAREVFKNTPWQKKAETSYAQYCQNVVDMLVGREAKKGGLRYSNKESKFFIEDASANTGGNESPYNNPDLTWTDPRNPARTLTASQQLAKLKIDPEEFAKWAKEQGELQ